MFAFEIIYTPFEILVELVLMPIPDFLINWRIKSLEV
jgi:hypothetical protein